jgi:hypothetical protein
MVSLAKVAAGNLVLSNQILRQINSLVHAHQPYIRAIMNNPG